MEKNTNIESMEEILDAVASDEVAIKKDRRVKKANMVNKRIDFKKDVYRKIELMMPIYKDEIGDVPQNDVLSYVIEKAVNKLFEEDFKKKLEEL